VTFLAAVNAASLKQDFEADAVGAPPGAFTLARRGSGQEGQWIIQWHILKVEAVGDHSVVSRDEKVVLDARDGTFKGAGKVGLWTKADSVIEFDDFSVEDR
jgi:hypothetical protein